MIGVSVLFGRSIDATYGHGSGRCVTSDESDMDVDEVSVLKRTARR